MSFWKIPSTWGSNTIPSIIIITAIFLIAFLMAMLYNITMNPALPNYICENKITKLSGIRLDN